MTELWAALDKPIWLAAAILLLLFALFIVYLRSIVRVHEFCGCPRIFLRRQDGAGYIVRIKHELLCPYREV